MNGELELSPSPKIVILLIGTNTTADQNFSHGHTAQPVAEGTGAIVSLIRRRPPSTKILILRIFPRGGDGQQGFAGRVFHGSPQCIKTGREAGLLTRQLADGKRVLWKDIGSVFLRSNGSINTDKMPDLLHPNQAGAEAWVQAIEPELTRWLD
jgi:lysophospholipase L1-like esterase